MSTTQNPNVLKATRGIIYVIMGLAAAVAVLLSIVAVVLPFHWTEAVAALAKEQPKLDPDGLLPLLYVVFAFAIALLGVLWTIMRKLLAIVGTVADGDPFIRANAVRLKAIGWMMTAVYILGFPLGLVAKRVADKIGDNHVSVDVSLTGLLAILLVFVLAGVFEQGAAMREEMEGTV
jgi:hypothetical protein